MCHQRRWGNWRNLLCRVRSRSAFPKVLIESFKMFICCTLLQYIRLQRIVQRVCQFKKCHKSGRLYALMNYNMCNNWKRWGVSPMTKIFATPPAMKYYYVTIINAYVPVHKVAQPMLTILMRNRYRIWLSDKTCVNLATVTYAVPLAQPTHMWVQCMCAYAMMCYALYMMPRCKCVIWCVLPVFVI